MTNEYWNLGAERIEHDIGYDRMHSVSPNNINSEANFYNFNPNKVNHEHKQYKVKILNNNIVWNHELDNGLEVIADSDIFEPNIQMYMFTNDLKRKYVAIDRQNAMYPIKYKPMSDKLKEKLKIENDAVGIYIVKTMYSGRPSTIYGDKLKYSTEKYKGSTYTHGLNTAALIKLNRNDIIKNRGYINPILDSSLVESIATVHNGIEHKCPNILPSSKQSILSASTTELNRWLTDNRVNLTYWRTLLKYYISGNGPDIGDDTLKELFRTFCLTVLDNVNDVVSFPDDSRNEYYRNECNIEYIKFIPLDELLNTQHYDVDTDLLFSQVTHNTIDDVAHSIIHPYSKKKSYLTEISDDDDSGILKLDIKIYGDGIWYYKIFGIVCPIYGRPVDSVNKGGYVIKFKDKELKGKIEDLEKLKIFRSKEQAETDNFELDMFEVEKIKQQKELTIMQHECKIDSMRNDVKHKNEIQKLDIDYRKKINDIDIEYRKESNIIENNRKLCDYYVHIYKLQTEVLVDSHLKSNNINYTKDKYDLDIEALKHKERIARLKAPAEILKSGASFLEAGAMLSNLITDRIDDY